MTPFLSSSITSRPGHECQALFNTAWCSFHKWCSLSESNRWWSIACFKGDCPVMKWSLPQCCSVRELTVLFSVWWASWDTKETRWQLPIVVTTSTSGIQTMYQTKVLSFFNWFKGKLLSLLIQFKPIYFEWPKKMASEGFPLTSSVPEPSQKNTPKIL